MTGATGFIGGALCRALVGAGYRVRALVRPGSASKPLPADVEPVLGELNDAGSLAGLLEGAVAVVHCAGAVRGASRAAFMNANVAPVDGLARAARRAGTSRFILISSLAASRPELSPYADSKRAGEAALLAQANGLECIVLRPPAVYGPGDREMLPLFRLMRSGFAPVFTRRDSRFSLIFIGDLVHAIIAGLTCAAVRSGEPVFDLHDGHQDGYTLDDLIAELEKTGTPRVRRIPVPAAVLDIAAATNLLFARLFGYAPMLTPWKLRELRHPRWVCDNDAFSALTGWRPAIGFSRGLALALRENGGTNESPAEDTDGLS
ncbi:MAG: NAD-dependent epimerase/dehydratase family protein [Gammaproteobacteria bacterium]